MPSAMLGDANSPITQITDTARKIGTGVTTQSQISSTDTPCSFLEVTAYEGNSQPMMIGGSAVVLGTSPTFTDRVGSGVLYPGQSKLIATTNITLWYISGLAADWITWTVYK